MEIAALPGPRGLPLLGNSLQLDLPRLHRILEAWVDEYGPIYRVGMGPRTAVVIADHELQRELLKRRPEQLRRQANMQTIAREFGFDGLFTAEGARWRKQRRLLNAAFAPQHVRTLTPMLLTITERLRALWSERGERGEVIDVHEDLRRYAIDVTMYVAFGEDADTLRRGPDEFRRHIEDIFPSFNRRIMALIPYWRLFKLPRDRALDRDLAALRAKVGQRIDATRALLAKEPARAAKPSNLLEAMIAARDDEDPAARLDDDEIFANAVTILLAGEDTTANTAAWMLDHLARAPMVHQRLRAETEAVFAEARLAPDLDCFDRMPYLRGTVQEALRLRSPAPLMFYDALEAQQIGELEIPRGATVLLLTRKPAMTASNFERPLAFDPARWIDGERQPSAAHEPKAMLSFGYGPRLCPGRGVALFELELVASMIARNFALAPVDAGEAARAPDEVFGFTMSPAQVRLRLRPL